MKTKLFLLLVCITLCTHASDHMADYQAEMNRFKQVLQEASDEELFLMLRTAIYKGYVPEESLDPYFDMYYAVGTWFRTGLIYRKLSNRRDLLSQIYPNIERLDEYVLSPRSYIWNEEISAMRDTIMQTLAPDSLLYDSITRPPYDNELYIKYFSRPLMTDPYGFLHDQ